MALHGSCGRRIRPEEASRMTAEFEAAERATLERERQKVYEAKNDRLRDLVRRFARYGPWTTPVHDTFCRYCSASFGEEHDENCLWLNALALLDEAED